MKSYLGLWVTVLLLLSPIVNADDIDIYIGGNVSGPPLVMMSLDYRPPVLAGSLCTFDVDCADIMSDTVELYLKEELGKTTNDDVNLFEGFIAVLGSVISNPAFDVIHMGLMISNDIDNKEKTEGATLLLGYRELGGEYTEDSQGNTITATTGRQLLIDTLKDLQANMVGSSDAHQLYIQDQFMELYSYLNGEEVFNGKKTITNYGNAGATAIDPDFDKTIIDDPRLTNTTSDKYETPFNPAATFECSKLYGIIVAMNSGQGQPALKSEIETALSTDAAKSAENMIEYFNDNDVVKNSILSGDQTMNTWVISDENSKGTLPKWAVAGGTGDGLLSLENPVALEDELKEAFTEIISVSSTFVASSIPVNVFNQTRLLDFSYTALFRAESTVLWPGNLKRLKLFDSNGNGAFDKTIDALGNDAIESAGDDQGRIKTSALTFWTDSSKLPDPDIEKGEVENRDGRSVPRGAAGQGVPGFIDGTIGNLNSNTGARQLFVEPSTGSTLDDFNADATTVTALKDSLGILDDPGSGDDEAEAELLIQWMRGLDVDDEVPSPTGQDNVYPNENNRNWILGASIHSRPLVINYGEAGGYSPTNPNIRIFMGTNDGIFHSFENTSIGGTDTGTEDWGFIPREMLAKVSTLRENTQSSTQMIYGVDGAAVALTSDLNGDRSIVSADGDEAIVYFGLRRGGKSYYALDVSVPGAKPTLKWKITQTTGGDFDELGLTFSTPVVTKVNYNGTPTDVVIFAGGYNGGWDSGFTTQTGKDVGDADDAAGNAIYIVNARTGALVWKAVLGNSTGAVSDTIYEHSGLVDSIPSDVIATGSGDITTRLYVGDTGGAVWRVDLPTGSVANHRLNNWTVTKFAELGTDGITTDRRFFHAPQVSPGADSTGQFDGVLIASGNRADPNNDSVVNYLFYLKDRAVVSGSPSGTEPVYEVDDLQDITNGVDAGNLGNGWKLQLGGTGEKGLSTPAVLNDVVAFSSFVPNTGLVDCKPSEGEGFVYFVNLSDGSAFFGERSYGVGSGIPGDVIKAGEGFWVPGSLPDGGIDPDPSDPTGGQQGVNVGQRGIWKIYWREAGVDNLK